MGIPVKHSAVRASFLEFAYYTWVKVDGGTLIFGRGNRMTKLNSAVIGWFFRGVVPFDHREGHLLSPNENWKH